MTTQEAGRIGGESTKKRYGRAYYVELGKKGGDKNYKKQGTAHYKAMGRSGGLKSKRTKENKYHGTSTDITEQTD